ncbi:MAG TPA: POTRA domain-containing protein, partial [Puia sp.]|nr:POTRA domain-containing protein [Puia sp.]
MSCQQDCNPLNRHSAGRRLLSPCRKRRFKWILLSLLIVGISELQAQSPANPSADTLPPADGTDTSVVQTRYPFLVGDIYIKGNRVTKSYIITRELPFKKGDTLYMQDLVESFKHAKERIINTRLFNDVVIAVRDFRGYTVDIEIQVKERWYIFPLPYVRPVDRNFTAWAEHNYSLSRLDFG